MSAFNVVNKDLLPTERVLEDYFAHMGIELLKKHRFDVECKKCTFNRDMLRLDAAYQRAKCEDKDSMFREKIINTAILTIQEL